MTARTIVQLPEPLLGFGFDQQMEHPKDGLFLFGPLADHVNPAEMRIGIVGTADCIANFHEWSKRIRGYIPAANADVAHHAIWPGFQAVFGTKWPEKALVELTVDEAELSKAIRIENRHEAIYKAVSIFEDAIRRNLRQNEAPPALWFVVIPEEVHRYGRPKSTIPKTERGRSTSLFNRKTARKIMETGSLFSEEREAADMYRFDLNFHHQLKARLLEKQVVLQIVRDTTLTPEKFVVDGR
ncbi:MAG: hypothetical protein SXG53_27360, partial [Pseudomonadota bacterium]|nr:hypothetical protein [Pseudomonadota bacterium]